MHIQDKGPAFVLGMPKSGTTLMMSLLDGHYELLAFPEQCPYLNFPLNGTIGNDLLESLFQAKKIPRFHNQQIPADVVNREKKDYSSIDYSLFSRSATAFFRAHEKSSPKLSPPGLALLSLMHGFAEALGRPCFKRWVLKQTKYELRIEEIISDFPGARLLYIVRDPVQSSLSRAIKRRKKTRLSTLETGTADDLKLRSDKIRIHLSDLEEWKKSISSITEAQKKYPSQILVVKYEDLTAKPEYTMRQTAEFLDISWQPSLLIPTFMGKPWGGNSMRDKKFSGVEKSPAREIPAHIQWQVQGVLGRDLSDWGYASTQSLRRINLRGLFSVLPGEKRTAAIRNRLAMVFKNHNEQQR
jgi:hypothetical protein